jgi:hypothetical protein
VVTPPTSANIEFHLTQHHADGRSARRGESMLAARSPPILASPSAAELLEVSRNPNHAPGKPGK